MKKRAGGENRKHRPNLESLFNTLNMDVKKDPQDRVHSFHCDYSKLIEDHQLEKSFESDDMKKKRTKWLLSRVKPKVVRGLMEDEIHRNQHAAKKDLDEFMKLLMTASIYQHKIHLVEQKQFSENRTRGSKRKLERSFEEDHELRVKVAKLEKALESGNKRSRGPKGGCYKCKQDHWLRDCPRVKSWRERREIFRSRKNLRRDSSLDKNKSMRFEYSVGTSQFDVNSLSMDTVHSNNSSMISDGNTKSILALFADCVTHISEFDSGSDITLIPESLLDEVRQAGGHFEIEELNTPIHLDQVFDQGDVSGSFRHICTRNDRMKITLVVRSGGPMASSLLLYR